MKKRSVWSAPGEKPPCVGVWETDYIGGNNPIYQYWNGKSYRYASYNLKRAYSFRHRKSGCDQSKVRFRGLAEKP